MPDPYKKVTPGEPVKFSATAWNAMVEAGLAARRGGRAGAANPDPVPRRADIVRVKNDTGSDLSRSAVVALDEPIFLPADDEDAFLREVAFRAAVPDYPANFGRFAVLLGPIAADGVGRAVVAGVAPVRVYVAVAGHRWADIDDGSTARLRSCTAGTAAILWCEGDSGGATTGDQWAIVRLGSAPADMIGKTASTISPMSGSTPGSGTFTRYAWSGGAPGVGSLSSTGETFTVYNLTTITIATNRWAKASPAEGVHIIDLLEC